MRILVALVALVAMAALAACASVPTAPERPPAAVAEPAPRKAASPQPRVAADLEERAPPPPAPVASPVDEPSAAEAGEPAEEGIASYYADSLAGRRTASGQRYRPEVATCAHRTHKFGTRLVVTAVGSGRSAKCRVNDRGPFVEGRVLDVSKSVARELGMLGPGVLRVRVVVVEDEHG